MNKKINTILSHILEQPNIKKNYEDLKNYYIKNNLNNQAFYIEKLIEERFNDANNLHSNKQEL